MEPYPSDICRFRAMTLSPSHLVVNWLVLPFIFTVLLVTFISPVRICLTLKWVICAILRVMCSILYFAMYLCMFAMFDYVKRTTRTKFGERGFSHSGPAAWNSLPAHLRTIADTNVFKRHLKAFLFTESFA